MKITLSITGLFLMTLSSLVLALDNQEIVKIINHSLENHEQIHELSIDNKTTNSIKWKALYGPKIGKQIQVIQLKNHPQTLFAFRPSSKGQIFKSNNTGKTWEFLPSHNNTTLYDLASINERRLILGTEAGAYLSDDLGKHWRLVQNVMRPVNNIVVTNQNLILLLTDREMTNANLYRSIDGGDSWTIARLGLDTSHSIWKIAGRENILFASAKGLNVSLNGGQFWQQYPKWKNHPVLSIAATSKYTVYAATGELYKTNLTGQFWEKIKGIKGEIECVKVDSHDHIYAVGRELETQQSGLYRSVDQGKTWQVLHKFKRIDSFIFLDNNKILVTTDKGLALSDNNQLNYNYLPSTFSTSEIVDVLADENHLFAIDGDYHNAAFKNSLYRSNDSGKTWQLSYLGNAYNIVKFNHQLVLAADKNLILTSQDKGKTWKRIYTFHDNHLHLGLSVQNQALVLLRTDGQYISYNLVNWKKFSNPYQYENDVVYVDDKNRIYMLSDDAIKCSNNGGKTWISLLSNIHARGMISGYNSKVLLAAFVDAGVIKSVDGGKNWELINKGLNNLHFRKLKVINENIYYLATEQGIYRTIDGGQNWLSENDGLENKDILSLFIKHNFLLAGSNGSGVFTGHTMV